jgi:ATP-dependent Clp protease protease subunit
MSSSGVRTAHILLQSHGGYVSDGLCLYNYLSNLDIRFITYNCGAVASIAVPVFLVGDERVAADTARFMIHKSHASLEPGVGADVLKVVVEGLNADDARTETVLRRHLHLAPAQWLVHAHADLHLAPPAALECGLIHRIGVFAPPAGKAVINM